MGAPKGNKHAAKPAKEKSTSYLHLRANEFDKKAWAKAAKASGYKDLTKWVVDQLNRRSKP